MGDLGRIAEKLADIARPTQNHPDGYFINPYNFVPLPESGPVRGEPKGHLSASGLLCGQIKVTYTAVTPLSFNGDHREGNPVAAPIHISGEFRLPGSSIAGPVRALHETLTGSCLRVLDTGYVPIHRDPPVAMGPGWRMALVEDDPDGGIRVRLCEGSGASAAVWVPRRNLNPSLSLDTAARFAWDLPPNSLQLEGPRQLLKPQSADEAGGIRSDPDGPWITIVRPPLNRRSVDGTYLDKNGHVATGGILHVPFGRLTTECLPIPGPVLADYVCAAEYSHDVRLTARNRDVPIDIRDGNGKPVGRAQPIGDELKPGDRVWALVEGESVAAIKRAVIWRSKGLFPVAERIGDYQPCTDPRLLCPSCATFGMADESGAREGPARQDSYAGHVRFGWGHISRVDKSPTLIRPMGQPRPGSGQFYLDNDRVEGMRASSDRDVPQVRPLREWGSEADTGFGLEMVEAGKPETRREIRGRKRYWATAGVAPSAGSARYQGEAPAPGKEMAATERRLVPKGATITARVTFDSLDEAQLGALIVALSPNALSEHLPWPDDTKPKLVSHLGGGKGIGLGVVSSEITKLELHTEHRYEKAALKPRQAKVAPYVESLIRVTPDAVMATWPALLAMLSLDHVPAELVEYPPDRDGLVGSRSHGRPFKFEFWRDSQGLTGRIKILPKADSPDPAIEWAKPERKPISQEPPRAAAPPGGDTRSGPARKSSRNERGEKR